MALTDFDRALIAATQGGLPLVARPYEAVGAMLGVSGEQVRQRLSSMLDGQVPALGERIAKLPGVSHCYRRPRHLPEWRYNLFAMLHGTSRAAVEQQAQELAAILGAACRGHDILYSTAILKKTGLRLKN